MSLRSTRCCASWHPLDLSGRVGLGALGCWVFCWRAGEWRISPSRALALAGFGALSYAIRFPVMRSAAHIASGAGTYRPYPGARRVVPISGRVASAPLAQEFGCRLRAGGDRSAVFADPARRESSAIWAILVTLGAPLCYAFRSMRASFATWNQSCWRLGTGPGRRCLSCHWPLSDGAARCPHRHKAADHRFALTLPPSSPCTGCFRRA